MDTNVFISGLKPDDPYHSHAESIMTSMRNGEIRGETSSLTILEVASVSARLYRSERRTRGSEKERKVFVVRAVGRLGGLKIKFINVAGDGPSPIKGVQANLPSVFNEAILLSLRTGLRTLDLIHLAAARNAKLMNPGLGAFVTGDGEFLSNARQLADIVGMPMMSPREYVAALGKKSGQGSSRRVPGSHLVREQRDELDSNLSGERRDVEAPTRRGGTPEVTARFEAFEGQRKVAEGGSLDELASKLRDRGVDPRTVKIVSTTFPVRKVIKAGMRGRKS